MILRMAVFLWISTKGGCSEGLELGASLCRNPAMWSSRCPTAFLLMKRWYTEFRGEIWRNLIFCDICIIQQHNYYSKKSIVAYFSFQDMSSISITTQPGSPPLLPAHQRLHSGCTWEHIVLHSNRFPHSDLRHAARWPGSLLPTSETSIFCCYLEFAYLRTHYWEQKRTLRPKDNNDMKYVVTVHWNNTSIIHQFSVYFLDVSSLLRSIRAGAPHRGRIFAVDQQFSEYLLQTSTIGNTRTTMP